MAIRVPNSDCAFSSITGWDTVTNVPTLHATTNVTINTTARFTATFTAPNTTNKVTGVLIHLVTAPTTSMTVTLQQSTVDTAAATTVLAANLTPTINGWVYVRFATPFQFTTTAAGAYRFKIAGVGTAGTAAADSGALLYAFMATIDQLGALGASDTLYIQGENGTTTTRTITMDGTQSIGTYGDTVLAIPRTLGNSIDVSSKGILKWDDTASATLTLKGNLNINNGGECRIGNAVTPIPALYTAKLLIDSAVTGDHGVRQQSGGKFYAAASYIPTLSKTKLASGTGTTGSPLVTVDAVNWNVGDEIIVTATSNNATNYNETELKFIKTKIDSRTYTLSDTSGGIEAGFVNTHTTDAYLFHLTRNVIMTTNNTARAWYFNNVDSDSTGVNMVVSGVRAEYVGNATSGKEGFRIGTTGGVYHADDMVIYKPVYAGFYIVTTKKAQSYSRNYAVKSTSNATVAGLTLASCNNITLNDCASVGNFRIGLNIASSYNCIVNRAILNANNTAGSVVPVNTGGLVITNCSAVLNNIEINCNRNMGMSFSSSGSDTVFNNCIVGSSGNNILDIAVSPDTVTYALYNNCLFASTTLMNAYLGLSSGSLIRFHKYQQTDNQHRWYTSFGSAQSVGTGLTDTTVRTPGSLAVRLAPEESTTGFSWSFNIPAKAHSSIIFNGRFIKNTAFGTDAARVDLYLPGSATPDATQTLSNTYIETVGAVWDGVVLAASNTSNTDGLATVVVTGQTVSPNAYIYCDDFYNAGDTVTNTDKVTGLDTWYNGQPIQIISPQVLNITDIWSYPTNVLTTSGTVGKNVADLALSSNLIKDALS